MSVRRAVFRCSNVYELQSRGPVIASIAVSTTSSAVYIGLSDGSLEEHKLLQRNDSPPRLALSARKHVGQKVSPLRGFKVKLWPSRRRSNECACSQ